MYYYHTADQQNDTMTIWSRANTLRDIERKFERRWHNIPHDEHGLIIKVGKKKKGDERVTFHSFYRLELIGGSRRGEYKLSKLMYDELVGSMMMGLNNQ